MAIRLQDSEIAELIQERKVLPGGFLKKLEVKQKRGHKERELPVHSDGGRTFRIILRESSFNSLDFTAILAYDLPNSNQRFRLRRYNGKAHEHTNKIEKETFYDFHIHHATERYQSFGLGKEDAYAEVTDRYSTLQEALECLLQDCGFDVPEDYELDLFGDLNQNDC